VDDQPAWSIVCFFVARPFRGQGVTEALIRAAIAYAEEQGARIVEAYPIIPENSKNPALEAFTGVVSTFERLGFERVIQRSKIRPIMRYVVR
jgi:GNAT superfamily N-acetyltransferase